MTYVDGFLLAVPKARLDEYKALAARAGAIRQADDVGRLRAVRRAVTMPPPPAENAAGGGVRPAA